ncbi:MAG TPA: hypothetical protein VLH19_05440 [Patescibacteria group bacterium]|nr:hypothetical protein [Patescibacteria group bacterium]
MPNLFGIKFEDPGKDSDDFPSQMHVFLGNFSPITVWGVNIPTLVQYLMDAPFLGGHPELKVITFSG